MIFEGYTTSVVFESVLSDAPAFKKFRFIAGNLSLDFCNSVGGKRETIARENLHSYPHFLSWCEQTGLVRGGEVHRLTEQNDLDPGKGAAVLNRALVLREAIYRIFFAMAKVSAPSIGDLNLLNSELALALSRLRNSIRGSPRQLATNR